MTDHKVSDFVTKQSYHAVTLVSNYPVKATSETMSVVHFRCSSNSLLLGTDADVLKYELHVYPPALFKASGTMLQSYKAPQANAIQMSIIYQCDAWSWIWIWVNIVLPGIFRIIYQWIW